MLFSRTINVWLLATVATPSLAFSPFSKSPSPATTTEQPQQVAAASLEMTAMVTEFEDEIFSRPEIDISGVMAQVESALQTASESIPTSKSLQTELDKVSQLVLEESGDGGESSSISLSNENMVATAIAGSAIGVVAGSPLVLGAALGMAGSKLLDDSEEGIKNRENLEKLGKQITTQVHGALEFAQSELDKEEDLSKVPEKLLASLQTRAHELQEEAQEAPTQVLNAVKDAFESEEFQDELKQAPGRAFSALKGFIQSDEVKSASGSVWNAIKDTIASDEMKALQSRASQAVKETLEKKATTDV